MDSQRFKKVAELFEAARGKASHERSAYLRDACADDVDLLQQLETLLKHHDETRAGIDEPVIRVESPTHIADSVPKPETIGRYRILNVLGEGGMGIVYLAEQNHPRRTVALKVMKPGYTSAGMLKRFELETQVLARLQHPGIAQIHDAGTADAGNGQQPYFVMEYIRGKPLIQFVKQHRLDTRERLKLHIKVCQAVQHAHQHGVIHRDLKPSNILVTEDVQPKILDFGIARATDSDIQTTTLHTEIGQLIGTIPYMSPEQVAGDSTRLDARSDVYGLGVVMYELLSDRLPHDLENKSIPDAARVIEEQEPSSLSSVNRVFRGDLDTICKKALEKDPERRYQTAAELALDIQRYLEDQPIIARPPSTMYQLRKFAKRNKILVSGVAAVFIVLLLGIIGTSTFAIRESSARDEANRRAEELELVAEFQAEQLSGIDVPLMGVRMRTDLINQKRQALADVGLDEVEVEAAISDLEKTLVGINFTNAALRTLDENIFERALEAVESQFSEQPLVKAQLLQSVAETLRDLGLLDAAIAPQKEALEIHRTILGDEHPNTLTSANDMGSLLYNQGKLAEAETYFRETLEARRHILGDEHPDTLSSINDMGYLLSAQGKLNEAEPYLREALEARRRALGDEHPDTLNSVNNMGSLLYNQGKLNEAEPYFREALVARRRALGDEHPDTLSSVNNMGGLLYNQGKLAEAGSYFREVLEISRRVLGDEHPNTLSSVINMGFLLKAQGKLQETEPYFREALEASRRTLGDEHPNTLSSVNNMGFLLKAQGKLNEAEPYFREALETSRCTLGDEHPKTLISITNTGMLYQAQGKFDEAELYYREALEARRRTLGDEHPDTLNSVNNMGYLYYAQGKFDEAEPYYREALEVRRRTLGDEHPNTLISVSNMGILLKSQGKLDEAEPYLRETLEIRRRTLGDEHPRTLSSVNNMGILLHAQGKLAEAELYFREALETRRRILGIEHPDTLNTTSNMSGLLRDQSRFSEAEAMLLPAIAVAEAKLPAKHRVRRNLVTNVSTLYTKWDEAEPGKEYAEKAVEWRKKIPSDDARPAHEEPE